MQAIILAAGMGMRLRPLTNDVPKCMVKVNGVPMIERAINALLLAGIKKIVIGLGYKGEALKKYINEKYSEKSGVTLAFEENPDYDRTNNIYSLYLLREYLRADDTLLLESDLVYKMELLKGLAGSNEQNLAVVSRYEPWMDGTVTALDDKNGITDFIAKKDQKDADKNFYYKTVNIYKFSKAFSSNYYLPFLETYMNVFGKNSYYEACLKFIAQTDSSLLKAFIIDQNDWHEVDNSDDLEKAEKKFKI